MSKRWSCKLVYLLALALVLAFGCGEHHNPASVGQEVEGTQKPPPPGGGGPLEIAFEQNTKQGHCISALAADGASTRADR